MNNNIPENSVPETSEAGKPAEDTMAQGKTTLNKPDVPKKEKKPINWKKLIIPAAAAVLVIVGTLIGVSSYKKSNAKYKDAVEDFSRHRYSNAVEKFEELKGFKDSKKYIAYLGAVDSMKEKEYEQAKEVFTSLGSFEDSEKYVEECEEELNHYEIYNKANELFEKGDYEGALEYYDQLPYTFEDTKSYARECSANICKKQVEEKLSAKDYEGALALLKSSDGINIDKQERDKLMKECSGPIDYAKAEQAFNDGLFYTARKLYDSLGDYKDSAERAKQCLQPLPKSGEVYRNPDPAYAKRTVRVILKGIKATKYSDVYLFFKIYNLTDSKDEVYVSGVFLAPGQSVSIGLPEGRYVFKVAYYHRIRWDKADKNGDNKLDDEVWDDERFAYYAIMCGYDNDEVEWYGNEVFGDNGKYIKLTLSDDPYDSIEMKGGYYYTFTMETHYGNLGSSDQGYNNF